MDMWSDKPPFPGPLCLCRRAPRPGPLLAVKEPSNGDFKPSEDLEADSEARNELEEPDPCINPVDHMESDIEAVREVEKQDLRKQPVLGDSAGVIANKISKEKSPFMKESQNGGDMGGSPKKTNRDWTENVIRSEQGASAKSSSGGRRTSYASGNVHGNGVLAIRSPEKMKRKAAAQNVSSSPPEKKRKATSAKALACAPATDR